MFSQLSDGLQKIIVSILIFLLVFAIYISSRDTIPVSDSRWAVYIALSVVREGNTDLDEYAEVIDSHDNYAVHIVDDHLLSVFPLGTPLMAVPMMFVADKLSQPLLSLNLHEHMSLIRDKVASNLELLSGSIIAALASVVLYWLGRLYLDRKRSLVLLFIFAFCTSMWSTASRALWQHGPSVLMLLLALYLVLAAKNKPGLIQFASLPLAYAYVIRPTNSISVIFISLYVLIAYRKQFIKYLLWASVIAVPFLISNYAIYDNILAPYYVPQRLELFGSTFGEALAGNLVSPARGLLIYSPILLFAGYGVVLKIKKSQFELLDGLIVCILLLHWLTISSFPHWYGGHSYGPRFFTDMLPYLMYFLIPVVGEIPLPTTIRKIPFAFLFLILVLISFFIHLRGATETSAALWNGAVKNIVDDVDLAPERVWDWSDPQFLRGLRPAKLSVLQQYPYFKLEQNSETDQKLTIFNRGDKELTLDVETPSRIKLTSMDEKEEMLLRGMSTREFAISIDTMGYDEGVYNLGGIYLSGVSSGHNSVKNSPIVVPVTVEIVSKFDGDPAEFSQQYLIPIVMSSEEQPDRFVPPMDLIVNGQEQMTTSNQIQAVFGAGWYDLEQHGNYQWRWATSPAVVYVYSPSPQKVKIASTAGSLFSNQPSSGLGEQGVLEITTNGENIANLSVHTGQSFAAEIELQTGWNVIVIELEAGNFIPAEIDPASGDARQLSFSLDKINILTE